MFSARRSHHPAIACALASALLMSAMSGAATARPNQDTQVSAALAQERYYSSYGEPAPLIVPQSPAPSDDTRGYLSPCPSPQRWASLPQARLSSAGSVAAAGAPPEL